MGIWGTGIRHDDAVCDVIDELEDLLIDEGLTVAEACARFDAPTSDSYDDLIARLARADFYLEVWRRDSPEKVRRRRVVLRRFAAKLVAPNPRPRKARRRRIRRPKLKPGTCLSVRVSERFFAADFVIAEDAAGDHLVGVLPYLSETPPDLEVFRQRRIRRQTDQLHRETGLPDASWFVEGTGWPKLKKRVEILGELPVRDTDPTHAIVMNPWHYLGRNVFQHLAPPDEQFLAHLGM